MGLEIPDGASHPVQWTIDYYKKKGVVLQPNVAAQLMAAWEAYIKDIREASKKATPKAKTLAHESTASAMPPKDSSWFSGFTLGRKKNGEEDFDEEIG